MKNRIFDDSDAAGLRYAAYLHKDARDREKLAACRAGKKKTPKKGRPEPEIPQAGGPEIPSYK